MKHQSQHEILDETQKLSGLFDEDMLRSCTIELVRGMPFEELEKIFSMRTEFKRDDVHPEVVKNIFTVSINLLD